MLCRYRIAIKALDFFGNDLPEQGVSVGMSVLVETVTHGLKHQILKPRIHGKIRETLTQINGLMGCRKLRHLRKNGNRKVRHLAVYLYSGHKYRNGFSALVSDIPMHRPGTVDGLQKHKAEMRFYIKRTRDLSFFQKPNPVDGEEGQKPVVTEGQLFGSIIVAQKRFIRFFVGKILGGPLHPNLCRKGKLSGFRPDEAQLRTLLDDDCS
jgi:hypothetical protein